MTDRKVFSSFNSVAGCTASAPYTTRQIATMYVVLILLLSGVALALALAPGVIVGRMFARAVADLLNFTIANDAIPAWVFAVQGVAGLLVPLLVAAYPIIRASRITVYAAISDYGVSTVAASGSGIIARLSALRGLNRTLLLALRNTFRRRARLLLTLTLLAAGGAMFMTGLNIRDGWERIIADGLAARRYNLEIRLSRPEEVAPLIARLRGIAGVQMVEAWGYTPHGAHTARRDRRGAHLPGWRPWCLRPACPARDDASGQLSNPGGPLAGAGRYRRGGAEPDGAAPAPRRGRG
jgi:hypothetical protein